MIVFEDASYTYPLGTRALSGVNLQLGQGDFLCLLGANGSGKSTLAKHMNALLAPSSGRVLVEGLDTREPQNLLHIRQAVGMVFQNPGDQLVSALVEDEVAFGPENLGLSSAEIRRRVGESLERVGLAGFQQRETSSLSGGQKQRLAIAGVLACAPRILVLDEASAMLDPAGRRQLAATLKQLQADGLGIVCVSHNAEEIAWGNRVALLDRGRLAWQGSPAELLAAPQLLESFELEAPFAGRLSRELQDKGLPVPSCCSSEELARALLRLQQQKGARA